MPIVDGSLKQQIFSIESKMANRVEKVFLDLVSNGQHLQWKEDMTNKMLLDRLLIQYENAVKAMQEEIINPVNKDIQLNGAPPNMFVTSDIVKRLHKGYLRFVYDTTDERLKQYFQETEVKEELNPTDEEVITGEDTLPDGSPKPEGYVEFI